MLYIDDHGHIDDDRIIVKIFNKIERDKMDKINGIVVHQTNAPTASSTFNSYQNAGANGAHFLIDRDATIYQTASVFRVTWHVGTMKSRCYLTKKCKPAEFEKAAGLEKSWRNYTEISKLEKKKKFPDRYPGNIDSIGIEIVGKAQKMIDEKGLHIDDVYEPVNDQQNRSLDWLIKELSDTLKTSMKEIYRHSEIARKNKTEASTATW